MGIIGKRIKELREENDLNQKQLADILGIQNTTLSQYESGARTPSDDIKKAIADYFEVSLDYLMGRNADSTYLPPDLKIPENVKNARIAFYGGIEDLTQEDLEDVNRYIEFIKSKKQK